MLAECAICKKPVSEVGGISRFQGKQCCTPCKKKIKGKISKKGNQKKFIKRNLKFGVWGIFSIIGLALGYLMYLK